MKLGADATASRDLLARLMNWRLILGVSLFAGAVIFYTLLLELVPLNLAQSLTVLQFAGVNIAAIVLLGESVSPVRILGFALIALGLLLVAASSSQGT
jgi:drug/metabolite transporter (DMT)-like permease